MVLNNINPLNEWSAAPDRIREECTLAFNRYMQKGLDDAHEHVGTACGL
jgi:hypothetical protein